MVKIGLEASGSNTSTHLLKPLYLFQNPLSLFHFPLDQTQ